MTPPPPPYCDASAACHSRAGSKLAREHAQEASIHLLSRHPLVCLVSLVPEPGEEGGGGGGGGKEVKTGTVGLSHCGDGVSGAVSGGRGGRGPRLAGVSIVERLIKIVECTSEGPWTRVAAIKVLTQAQILKSTPYIDFYISKYTRALTFESRTHSLTRVSGCCCPCHRARADGAGGLPGYAPDPRKRFVCGQPHA